jgi:nucleolar pre-ribosomal-associated protein 2
MDAAPAVRGLLSADFVAAFPARQLEEYADGLLLSPSSSGAALGWRVKAFLVANFAPALQDPRPCRFGRHDAAALLPGDGRAWRLAAGECVDAVLAALPREEQLAYAWELVRALDDVGEPEGRRRQLFALRRAVDALVAMPDGGGGDRFGFAGLHGELAARLRDGGRGGTATMATPDELARLLDLVHVLLDKKAGFMTQWSVESTLGAVCVLCCTMATMSTTNVSTTPTTPTALVFPRVFAVVETLIKRHRVRLEGHYHIITTTLQCLLAVLMAGGTPAAAQETHARMFARLVTLLCTPTAGAVGRPHHHHHGNPANAPVLDSATAAAKRFAGQYMYVVLTAYVRLLLEGEARQRGVGRAVRDALEPAWHAAFDVMPPDTRRILNDGMDEGGREVVREMWKRYTLFGKWSGV